MGEVTVVLYITFDPGKSFNKDALILADKIINFHS